MRRSLPVFAVLAALLLLWGLTGGVHASEALKITSHVTYDVKTLQDVPVGVSWDVTAANNDPATQNTGQGTVSFYNKLALPLLRDATKVSAHADDGTELQVTVDDSTPGPAVAAQVTFDQRLFYKQSYNFTLSYQLPEVREDSLLVTPGYAFVPIIAAGDDATVTVNTPSGDPWSVSLEAADCARAPSSAGSSTIVNDFTCTGSGGTYLAALAEVSRPDALSTIPFDVQMKSTKLTVSLAYFQGDDETARHLQDVVAAALPVIEDVYGVPYSGPATVSVAQGGRQVVLGFEGLTECTAGGCHITISPLADDSTVIHELSHLWSSLYSKRWLSEGFAQIVEEETAARLPPGLVHGDQPGRQPATVQLQLDDWGEVKSVIGTSGDALAKENAGYDRSLRFLEQLRQEVGLPTLQKVNQAIAAGGSAADSGRFLDRLEDVSGRNLDDLFLLWVFPDSQRPILELRREARDRLTALNASVQDTGLSTGVVQPIQDDVNAWRFGEALAALDTAEAGLATYDSLVPRLADLRRNAQTSGLSLADNVDQALKRWDFAGAGDLLSRAEDALQAYTNAHEKVDASRNLWERFGLLGSDPSGDLKAAEQSFAGGDYASAVQHANSASHAINNAGNVALRRMLIFAGILIAIAVMIGVALWLSHVRERQLARR